MKKEDIEEYFYNQYLVCGNTYDNFVFEGCSIDFLKFAKNSLNKSQNGVQPVNVCFTDKEEANFEATTCFLNDYQTKLIARDYVCTKIFIELLKDNPSYINKCKSYQIGLNAIIKGDIDNAIGFHCEAPMPCDIINISKKTGKIELNIFMLNTKNIYFQQAINTFISMRTPFSIKLFTNSEILTTRYDLSGCLIECPHDFMKRDVNKFINNTTQK